MSSSPYVMKISRLTVDKLGVRLYDKVSAVIAELVANSYDADATEVLVKAPMGKLLATKHGDEIIDSGYFIEVIDNGIGMTPSEVNDYYLRVGAERRKDNRRGDVSRKFGRKVMGRKGVGKLAPFGICSKVELITAGGELVERKDEQGNTTRGYLTAHLILDQSKILNDEDEPYRPDIGQYDGTLSPKTGTTIRLTEFTRRKVPDIDEFERQLSQRFGLTSENWQIILIDTTKEDADPNYSRKVGEFEVAVMEGTKINFVVDGSANNAYGPDGNTFPDIKAGFTFDDKFYPIKGWVAYSQQPYRDDLMAGVRIYCRGKIASQTSVFNRKAGFTGEHNVRSYLIGELHVDWLDEYEDLIQTDRRDILWSHELGQAFQQWGQLVVQKIGKIAREPMRRKTWELFKEKSNLEDTIKKEFPLEEQKEIRDNAFEIAKVLGQNIRGEELEDEEVLSSYVHLSLTLAPHITLDRKLREAVKEQTSPLGVLTGILKTAKVAELSSFGRIAYDRIKVIDKVEALKDDGSAMESVFQKLITEAPWLINPQWSPITFNQSFTTLKREFQKYYKEQTGEDLILDDFSDPHKRVDFVLSNQDNVIQMVEIKRPNHQLTNEEMERIDRYIRIMKQFLSEPANKEFSDLFPRFHLTLVCDKIGLDGVHLSAFDGFKADGILTHINWNTFLLRTKKMHEAFLNEAERQRQYG